MRNLYVRKIRECTVLGQNHCLPRLFHSLFSAYSVIRYNAVRDSDSFLNPYINKLKTETDVVSLKNETFT